MANWRRRAMVSVLAPAMLAAGPGRAVAASPAVSPSAPAQISVTIPAGPLIISLPFDDDTLLAWAGHQRPGEHEEVSRGEIFAGVSITDTRADGGLPWRMTIETSPGTITITIG